MIWIANSIKACDECGEHFHYDSDQLLGGFANMLPGTFLDICLKCATKLKLDVCHGSCLRWHYKSALTKDGLCAECYADELVRQFNSRYVVKDELVQVYNQLRKQNLATAEGRLLNLCDEAVVRGADLRYLASLNLI